MPKGVDWNKQVAVEIIKAGYFALAKKNHPDHGGSHDKFLILSATKEYLDSLMNGAARQESKTNEPPPKRPYKHQTSKYRPPGMFSYAVGWWFIINVECIRTSDKAVLVEVPDGEEPIWFPKSQLHRTANQVWEYKDKGDIVFSEWISRQKGWL